MIFPYSTDAPLYYRPIGTLSLICLNGLVFSLLLAAPDWNEALALHYGVGLTPVNWITSNFVHANVLHLIGNMIFLWSFGLIVEGKLGWARFILLFVLIGALECLVEQLIFWNSTGSSIGASAVIFGLMAICLIWAPKNDLSVFYLIGFRPGVIEIPIIWFAILTLAKSVLMYGFLPFAANELLHLLGAAAGVAAGVLLLKYRQVDCEGWDLWSVTTGNIPVGESHYSWQYQQDTARRRNKRVATRQKPKASSGQMTVPVLKQPEKFSELVVQGKAHAAYAFLQKIRLHHPDFTPSEDELLTLARSLRKRQAWSACVDLYEELIRINTNSIAGRLELAEVLVMIQNRPSAARRLLAELTPEKLTAKQTTRLQQLQRHIEDMIQSGIMEIRE